MLPVIAGGSAPGAELLAELDVEVELGGTLIPAQWFDGQAGEFQRRVLVVLKAQRHLEQRVARHRPGRRQVLHQPLERQVLVGERLQRRLPDLPQEVPEGERVGHPRAEHQRVDEQPDQIVQGLVQTPRDRHADRDVVPCPEPGQQDGEGCLRHHEHGGALGLGGLRQPLVELGRDGQPHHAAHVRGPGGTWPVRREFELVRHTGERATPVGELLVEEALRIVVIAQQVSLPQGVVGVLHLKRCPLRYLSAAARRVGDREVARQRPPRPPVARDVVHHDDQRVIVRRHGEEPGAQRDVGLQVEGVPGRLGQ